MAVMKSLLTFEFQLSSRHVKYLLLETGIPGSVISCDMSSLIWTNVIKTEDFDLDVMEAILSHGGTITLSECKVIISKVPDTRTEVLAYALEKAKHFLNKKNLNLLGCTACKFKKLQFISILLYQGSNIEVATILINFPPSLIFKNKALFTYIKSKETGLEEFIKAALDQGEFDFLENNKSILISRTENAINVSVLIRACMQGNADKKNRCLHFIKGLLDDKTVDPNGLSGKVCPLDKILELPKACNREKIDLLCLLLQSGADIQRCSYPRKEQTTVIHIAAQIVMDESEYYVL